MESNSPKMKGKSKPEKSLLHWIGIVALALVAIVVACYWLRFYYFPCVWVTEKHGEDAKLICESLSSLSGDTGVWGQFGDFAGGTLNPIFGFLTVMLLVLSIRVQKEELEETRKELANSSAALELQAKIAKEEKDFNAMVQLSNFYQRNSDEIDKILMAVGNQQDLYDHHATRRLFIQSKKRVLDYLIDRELDRLVDRVEAQNPNQFVGSMEIKDENGYQFFCAHFTTDNFVDIKIVAPENKGEHIIRISGVPIDFDHSFSLLMSRYGSREQGMRFAKQVALHHFQHGKWPEFPKTYTEIDKAGLSTHTVFYYEDSEPHIFEGGSFRPPGFDASFLKKD